MSPDEARKRLLEACDREVGEVLRKDYGYQRPDPGKLIREGIHAARRVIEALAPGSDLPTYLAEVGRLLEALKERCRQNPISNDGWDDEDGYILGGISAIQRSLEELKA